MIGFYLDVMLKEFIVDKIKKREGWVIPPIRKNNRSERLHQNDVAVIIGNSRQTAILNEKTGEIVPLSDVQEAASSVQEAKVSKMVSKGRKTVSKGRKTVSKGKNKRSRRVAFVPNKVSKMKLIAWKRRYGSKFHVFINMAIEKFEP